MENTYLRPVIKQECLHCKTIMDYYYEDITKYGEVICKHCSKTFWSTQLLDFTKKIEIGV